MAIIGQGISHVGIVQEAFHLPFYLEASITAADVGKAVTLDSTAANTVKIAGDGDQIIGRLETFENRSVEGVVVGAVATRGGWTFTKSGAVNVGDTVVGAPNGEVKAAAAADYSDNMVVESGATTVVVLRA